MSLRKTSIVSVIVVCAVGIALERVWMADEDTSTCLVQNDDVVGIWQLQEKSLYVGYCKQAFDSLGKSFWYWVETINGHKVVSLIDVEKVHAPVTDKFEVTKKVGREQITIREYF
jgi:hypothetical protein